MTLQDRINGLKPYFRGVEMYNDALIVKMQYPTKWKEYGSLDDKIRTARSEEEPNLVYYYADSNISSYDDIFNLIEETIRVNQEMKLKLELLRDKFEELKEIFSDKPYDILKTLEFSFKEPLKTKGKRKYTKRKKAVQNAQECVTEASIDAASNSTSNDSTKSEVSDE